MLEISYKDQLTQYVGKKFSFIWEKNKHNSKRTLYILVWRNWSHFINITKTIFKLLLTMPFLFKRYFFKSTNLWEKTRNFRTYLNKTISQTNIIHLRCIYEIAFRWFFFKVKVKKEWWKFFHSGKRKINLIQTQCFILFSEKKLFIFYEYFLCNFRISSNDTVCSEKILFQIQKNRRN